MTTLFDVFSAIRADEGDHVGKCCERTRRRETDMILVVDRDNETNRYIYRIQIMNSRVHRLHCLSPIYRDNESLFRP